MKSMALCSAFVLSTLLFISPSFSLRAEDQSVPRITLSPCLKPPVIDGQITGNEWKRAAALTGFATSASGAIATRQTRVLLTYDSNNLYIAFLSRVDRPLVAGTAEKNGPVTNDDAIEIFIKPAENAPAYYHFAANSIGVTYEARIANGKSDKSWNGRWTCKSAVEEKTWTAELAIPFPGLNVASPADGRVWRMNFCRDWQNPPERTSWSHAYAFKEPARFGEVSFRRSAPVIRQAGFGNLWEEKIDVQSKVLGPPRAQSRVALTCILEARKKNISKWIKKVTVPAGETVELNLMRPLVPGGDYITFLYRDRDTGETCSRSMFPVIRLIRISGVTYEVEKAALTINIDASGVPPTMLDDANVKLSIIDKGKNPVGAVKLDDLSKGSLTVRLNVAKLRPGDYDIVAALYDKSAHEVARSASSFKKIDESIWLGNKIGISDKVPPPWTPMKVNGKIVRLWGREYRFGESPFPEGVITRDELILASPIRLRLDIGGKEVIWKTAAAEITHASETEVRLSTKSEAPGIELHGLTSIEYDGMIRTDLKLKPARPVEIRKMYLEIPLKDKHAKYIHCTKSRNSSSFAGTIGADGWKGPFHPLVMLTDEDRGLCWFTESMKNWHVENEDKVFEITKTADTVIFRVNIIDSPVTLSEPAAYTFGLQALPARPMPSDWRALRMSGKANFGILWPYDESDTDYQYSGYPTLPAHPGRFRSHIAAAHQSGRRQSAYTWLSGVSGDLPEYGFFRDWRPHDAPHDGAVRGIFWSVCARCSSLRDFNMLSWAKLFDEYDVDGLYYDGAYPAACANAGHGCGYVDWKGERQVEYPFFSLRRTAKRAYTMMCQKRENPLVINHMSGNVAPPVQAFGHINIDGEHKGFPEGVEPDYHNIMTLDELRAEFTGRQTGLVPAFITVLAKGRNMPRSALKDATVSMLSLLFLHDIIIWPAYCDSKTVTGYDDIRHDFFGTEQGDLQFLPYWSNGDIFRTCTEDVKVSAYLKDDKCLMIISNLKKSDINCEVAVNFDKLGLNPAKTGITDAKSGEIIPLQGTRINVPVKGWRLRMLLAGEKK